MIFSFLRFFFFAIFGLRPLLEAGFSTAFLWPRRAPPPPEKVAARRKKAATYAALMKHALAAKAAHKHDSETYAVVEKLLLASPDVPTLWNYRREMLLAREAKADGEMDADETRAELALTQKCLMKQPKSYAAWHHRLWIVRRRPALAKDELALCAEFLKLDERNFHCWNYYRHVRSKMPPDPQSELDFTTRLIQRNFSNASAWHQRSKVLPLLSSSSYSMIIIISR